jgi:hypothetical protein
VQNLKYAALALQYFRQLGGGALESEFIRRLSAAPGDGGRVPDGGDVYRRRVRPAVVGLDRVVAHYAITGLVDDHADTTRIYAYRVERLDEAAEAYGETQVRIGHVRATFETTGEAGQAVYAVVHFGGHDVSCGVGPHDDVAYQRMKADLLRRYERHSMADMVRGLDEHFPRESFSLRHLFFEERRRVLGRVMRAVLARHEEAYRRIWEESRQLVEYLREVEAPIPEVLRLTGQYVLEKRIAAELPSLAMQGTIPPRMFDLADEARAFGLTLDLAFAEPPTREAVHRALARVDEDASPESVAAALSLIEGAERIGIRFARWAAQNEFYALWRRHPDARARLQPIATALDFALAEEAA